MIMKQEENDSGISEILVKDFSFEKSSMQFSILELSEPIPNQIQDAN